ncbi:gem-associated protein 8 isoform X2 [Sceloporus undulatus]|nr:gem-associated protein 8 isoform X2 [Sceloporus undulatus]XP_042316353.1 gem-associated protein 8 isoform X2 [Sceloporus undulatus]XP_042316354.1 gem-associated protein 8 isoform X2 [Sceloporus undulatus]
MSQVLEPWYSQKVYARYWKHYNQAMEWMHRHKHAYKKAIESLYNPSFCPPANYPSRRYSDWDEGNHLHDEAFTPHSKSRYYPRSLQALCNTKRREVVDDSETDTESEDEEDIEYDLSNMEITEELRQYFEQTEKHREELRKQQKLEAEHQDMYVEADHDLHLSTGRSAQPPAEKPGERRIAEMRKLYGVGASKIQAMETTMQLSFDRKCDKKQPKYWPIIPLKL